MKTRREKLLDMIEKTKIRASKLNYIDRKKLNIIIKELEKKINVLFK